jgi:hypothetical protein
MRGTHSLEGEHGMSCYPDELKAAGALDATDAGGETRRFWSILRARGGEPSAKSDDGLKPWVFWSIFVVAITLMAYGFYLGNPFETYHNGSTL